MRTIEDVYSEHYNKVTVINYSDYANIEDVLTDETRVGYNKINLERFQMVLY